MGNKVQLGGGLAIAFNRIVTSLIEARFETAAGVVMTLRGALESGKPEDLELLLGLIDLYDTYVELSQEDIDSFRATLEAKAS